MSRIFGALPSDWSHFDFVLGLGDDLLPVVSNPDATISENSKMAAVGKTPSTYNSARKVRGIEDWTSRVATQHDLGVWSTAPDYGICVQTRRARAIDVDVTDAAEAAAIAELLHPLALPCRFRSNSSKFLLALTLPGEYRKQTIKTKHGIVEFLAGGNQFVAVGTHPSGARYEWREGLPTEIPEITAEQFAAVWAEIQLKFGIAPATEAKATVSSAAKISSALSSDRTAKHLLDNGYVLSTERDGRLHITCPFSDEHTGESAESATTYFPAHTGGYALGHFKCLHAHCESRTDGDFRDAIDLSPEDDFADYTDVDTADYAVVPEENFEDYTTGGADTQVLATKARARFAIRTTSEFLAEAQEQEWLIKGLIPKAELAFVYGPPSGGKTFWVLDAVLQIVQGLPWNGRKASAGRCLYVASEDAHGVRKRLSASVQFSGERDLSNLLFIAEAPRLQEESDRKALWQAIKPLGPLDVIVIDTMASSTLGADENSGKELGPVLHYCKELHARTGALIVFVHHTGKDATRGTRGWSGLLGNADCQILIERFGDDRVATVTKLKNGKDNQEFGFRLQEVELGRDRDGDAITSCVVHHLPPSEKVSRVTHQNSSVDKLLLRALDELMGLAEDPVTVNDVIERVANQLVPPEEGKRDTRRQKTQTAYEALLVSGAIISDGGLVRLA